MKRLSGLLIAAAGIFALSAEAAPMSKKDCLACHGPYETLVSKNIQVESDSGPVNPHVYLPHKAGAKGDVPECLGCHMPHQIPPPSGYTEPTASLEGCYGCHHTYEFKPCGGCHESKR